MDLITINTECHDYWVQNETWLIHFDLPDHLKIEPEGSEEFSNLWNRHPAEQATFNLFGPKKFPRYQQTYGADYHFSGVTFKGEPVYPHVQNLFDYFTELFKNKYKFNGALFNWYDGGSHYIGPHQDDEKDLVPESPVITITFGTTRIFRIKNLESGETISYTPEHNSVLIMGGNFQKTHKHSVPKQLKIKGKRVSVTLRAFKK